MTLKEFRTKHGCSRRKAAGMLGISESMAYSIEVGRRSQSRLLELAIQAVDHELSNRTSDIIETLESIETGAKKS
jgi:DNA-binding XRE family transcriptional regulator